jgi:hypothetical protein
VTSTLDSFTASDMLFCQCSRETLLPPSSRYRPFLARQVFIPLTFEPS